MLFDQIASNKTKNLDFVAGIFPTLSSCWLCGWLPLYAIWAWSLVIALIIGFIYALSMIFQSTEIVMSMNGAREVDEQTAPDLYHVVEDMAMVAQIPMPRVFIIDDPALNAFATGSNPQNAAVAATSGLLAIMNREELEAVMDMKSVIFVITISAFRLLLLPLLVLSPCFLVWQVV